MSDNVVEIKETCDEINIKIDKTLITSELSDSDIIDEVLSRRIETDVLSYVDEDDLVCELKDRYYDFRNVLNDSDVSDFVNELISEDNVSSLIWTACRKLSPRRYLDKNDMKEMINQYIDENF